MALKDFGKELKSTLQVAADTVKQKAKDIEMPDLKQVGDKVSQKLDKASEQIKTLFKKPDGGKDNAKDNLDTVLPEQSITKISVRNAIKVIYFMMAADGKIYHGEEEKFDAIAAELDPDFASRKEQIIKECQASLDKVIDPEDYYDALQDGVGEALIQTEEDSFITPKVLTWNLLSLAYSDASYNDAERKLLKYVVRKLNVDKGIFLEMESSMLTLIDLEKELAWIKTTNRPYLTIEAMVNEIADRKNVITESILDLITL